MYQLTPFKHSWLDNNRFNSFFNLLDDTFTKFNNGPTFDVDVKETKTGYELIANLPGISKENIKIDYDNNYLTISTTNNEHKEEKDEDNKFIRQERYTGSFTRSFYVGHIDKNQINATLSDGVLKIQLPKSEHNEKATININ